MFVLPFAMISATTVVALCAVGVLLFGNRVPEMGKLLAQTIRGFRDTLNGVEENVSNPLAAPPQRLTVPGAAERNGLA